MISHVPSGPYASAGTTPGCGSVARTSPLAASQSFTVASQLPEAITRPSGLNATGYTDCVCPRRTVLEP